MVLAVLYLEDGIIFEVIIKTSRDHSLNVDTHHPI